MTDGPFLEPEDRDESDDEIEADLDPIAVCNHCGSSDCTGLCFTVAGYGAP